MANSDSDPPIIPIPNDPSFYKNQKKLVIILENSERHENVTFDNKIDIKRSIRVDLANYISNETYVAGNQFPIASGYVDSVSRDSDGNPASLIDAGANGQSNYIDSVAPNAKSFFAETSHTKQLDTDSDGTFKVKKGKLNGNGAPTGDSIYRDINVAGDNSQFAKRVQNVLLENNHYNVNSKFINNPGAANENDLKVATVSYNTLGLFGPKKFPSPTQDVTENNRVSLREMKRMGLLTLLAGAGGIVPALPADKSTDVWFGEVAAAAAVTPGLASLGVKFPTSRFDANQVIKAMKPDFVRPTNTQFLDGKTNYTYGNANTPFAQFDGLNSIPSVTSATILIATVGGLLYAFSQLKFVKQSQTFKDKSTLEGKHRFLGNSDGVETFEQSVLDTPKLKHEFFACLNEGIRAFFGLDSTPNISTNPSALQAISGVSKRITDAHGYFNVILRQITRGTSDIIGGIGASLGVRQGSNFEPRADEIIDQFNPEAVVKRLKAQPIVKFVNMLVTIGDRMIERQGTIPEGIGVDDTISIIDSIKGEALEDDKSVIDPAILIAKNRLKDFGNISTMANMSIRSLLIMPQVFTDSATSLGKLNNGNPKEAQTALGYRNKISFQNRIDPDTVKEFEDYLEKDYMPFYFQDLRTNEILSFHAFLGDLNESLNADYNETEGYGRIGTVPIYKNTKRSISFSFYLVSTGDDDFDEMWYKFNRLAMMMFPQWSEGRKVEFAGNKFIQPFSQVPAASPMIRIRVGDLWKTNYSKFAAARLFGLSGDTNQFKIGDMKNVPSAINNEAIAEEVKNILQKRTSSQYVSGDKFRIKTSALTRGNDRQLHNTVFRLSDGGQITNPSQSHRRNTGTNALRSTDNRIPTSNEEFVKDEWLEPAEYTVLQVSRLEDGYVVASVSESRGALFHHLVQGSGGRMRQTKDTPSDEQFIVAFSLIDNSYDIVHEQAVKAVTGRNPSPENPNDNQNEQENSEIVQKFFADSGPNANPIMKAFKSTEGRGIAGFIRTMTPDFNQTVWETEKFGGRAPKFLKIQIEFIPIWDINPGLDSNGAMTAPIWNVGKIMNNYHGGTGLDKSTRDAYEAGKRKLPKI
jgi:hypothetical protein